MGNGYYNMVVAVVLVVNLERTRTLQDSCEDCPAGTFCENTNQNCIPCPSNTFSSTGGQMACNFCRRCEGIFKTRRACSPTSNSECECVSGYHCVGVGCSKCQKDRKQGQESTKKDCCFGTFRDQKLGTCRPWTNCSLDGKSVLVNGTKERDVVCGPPLVDFSPGTSLVTVSTPERKPGHHSQIVNVFLALTSAAVLFLVFFLVSRISVAKRGRKKLLYIFKQPFIKPVQTAQEEDACSCRFPEEEEGDCDL